MSKKSLEYFEHFEGLGKGIVRFCFSVDGGISVGVCELDVFGRRGCRGAGGY